MSSRTIPIAFKVNLQEEKYLRDLARKNGMNSSEYIRARLFEDENLSQKSKELRKSDKDTLKLLVNCYNLIDKISENKLNQDELKEALMKSKDWLEQNEYN